MSEPPLDPLPADPCAALARQALTRGDLRAVRAHLRQCTAPGDERERARLKLAVADDPVAWAVAAVMAAIHLYLVFHYLGEL